MTSNQRKDQHPAQWKKHSTKKRYLLSFRILAIATFRTNRKRGGSCLTSWHIRCSFFLIVPVKVERAVFIAAHVEFDGLKRTHKPFGLVTDQRGVKNAGLNALVHVVVRIKRPFSEILHSLGARKPLDEEILGRPRLQKAVILESHDWPRIEPQVACVVTEVGKHVRWIQVANLEWEKKIFLKLP